MKRTRPEPWQGLETLESRQLLANIGWDGGGGDLVWHNPLNWSGDVLPGPDDDVFINIPGTPTVELSEDVLTSIRSLWSLEALSLSAGTVEVATSWRQSAPLMMSGGRIDGPGHLVLNAAGEWSGGEIAGSGKIQVLPGGELTISGSVVLGRDIVNNGSLIWEAGDITANGVRIHNLMQRTFLIHSDGTLIQGSGQSWIINGGTVALEGAPGVTTAIEIGLHNHAGRVHLLVFLPLGGVTTISHAAPGTVDVRSGTLSFTGQVLQKRGPYLEGGNWWVTSSDAELLLPGPSILTVASSTGGATTIILKGQGASFPQLATAFVISSLTLESHPFPSAAEYVSVGVLSIDNPGTTTAIRGLSTQHTVLRAGHLVIDNYASGFTQIAEHAQLSVTGQFVLPGPSFGHVWMPLIELVNGAGTLRLTGTMTLTHGEIAVRSFVIGPTGQLLVRDDLQGLNQRRISSRTVNYGTVAWRGADSWQLATELVNRGTFEVHLGGHFETSAGVTAASAPSTFHNFGTFVMRGAGQTTFRGAGGGVRFVNHGDVEVLQGKLNLFGGVSGGGAWTIARNAELAIGGLPAALHSPTIINLGLLRLGAHLTWSGGGSITGSGGIFIGTAGRLEVIGSDLLIVGGSMTNHGVIDLVGGTNNRIWAGLTNYGTLAVGPGDAIIDNLTLTSSSTLKIRSASNSQHGHLFLGGTSTLAGALVGEFAWQPPGASSIEFLMTDLITHGTFDSVHAAGLAPGRDVEFVAVGQRIGFIGYLRVV